MKLIVLAALLTVSALAKEECHTSNKQEQVLETVLISTDVPSHLKGAKIIVRRADGVESEVSAEQFKVVPRKQQRLVTKVENKELVSCKSSSADKNRVSLLGGYGVQGGLDRSASPNKVDVRSKNGAIGGLQYQRMLNDRFSVGAQGQSNGAGSLIIGVDF